MRAIDLFAGAGGFSEGARMAGAKVLWAANHAPEAVAVHMANHPETEHACQDLHQTNFFEVPAHDLLLASPCCQGHSRARGRDREHHDRQRSTAWACTSAAEAQRPAAFIVENVPSFVDWQLFPAWKASMELLGYNLSSSILDSQFFGVPQERKRIFIVGMRKKAFRFEKTQPREDLVPLSSILDLEDGAWSPISDAGRKALGKRVLVDATKARIAVGRKRFGNGLFWFPYFGANISAFSVDRPVWTITTRDRYCLCMGDQMRILTANEVRKAMGFPDTYKLSGKSKADKMLLGNAVVPAVASWLIKRVMEAA